ncbi:MAG: ABC transporter permease [Firmicutes bacterium HGW-Firmicutes-8]|nr:MAG: ABC transporter permease [Firmicutes bacterium HGW-Firmicutes-8]
MSKQSGFRQDAANHIIIFFHYMAQYIKTKMAYRADFFIYVFSDLLQQSVNLVFILVIFTKVPAIKGWTRDQILFIYGFFLIPFGLYSGFLNHLFDVPEKYVLEGELDRVLLRPLNAWFQVVVETMNPELLIGTLTGIVIMVYSGNAMGLVPTWWDFPLTLVLVFGATMIYAGVYTFLASLGFWTEGNMGLMPMVYNLSNYGRYPMTIYRGPVRFILTWVLPFAFAGFYPAAILMHRYEYIGYALLTPVIGILSFVFAYRFWVAGIRRYRGTGS